MVITGKSYGTTNLIALDRRGAVLVEASIVVQGPEPVSVVYFGMERETYSCTPKCERRVSVFGYSEVNNALGDNGPRGGSGSGGRAGTGQSGPCNSLTTPHLTAQGAEGAQPASAQTGGRRAIGGSTPES